MTHNTWARKYLKTMCKNFMTAFQMGYKGGGIAYPLSPCEALPEVQRQAAP
jgi:hypothetical protein|nr:MAG TPA_asm: hypothetical protein [Caudoviricetes sp.]